MLASFQTPNLAQPRAGSMGISLLLDFTESTVQAIDLTAEMLDGKLDFIQSVYIDNADNSGVIDLIFTGGPIPQRVRCPSFRQGWFPVSWPKGAARLAATTQGGIKVPVIFSNFAMPYLTWGSEDGTFVVPPLINLAVDALNFPAAGNQRLVAGIGGQTIRLYRGMFSVDQPVVLRWTDGPGGTVLFAAQLGPGGSVTFQATGNNWFNTSDGNDLTLNASGACNVYGGFGYVQD